MSLIDNLNWRYATKKFDPNKKVDPTTLDFLKESIRLAATSYGLQPFKVMVIDDADIKKMLKPLSFNQPQITDASHLFLFCNLFDVSPEYIDQYVKLSAKTRALDYSKMTGYSDFMKSSFGKMSAEEISVWAAKQAYIAMSNLLTACAELKVDSCPIEGFEKEAYNKALKLNDIQLESTVMVAVGYRSEDDATQFNKKVRLPETDLFI